MSCSSNQAHINEESICLFYKNRLPNDAPTYKRKNILNHKNYHVSSVFFNFFCGMILFLLKGINMENITEQSIIDKANKLYSIECTSISEVIQHFVSCVPKEISSHGVYLLLSAEYPSCGNEYPYITITNIIITRFKGSVCVFEGRKTIVESYLEHSFEEQWFYDEEIKDICLRLIDDFLENHIIQQKKESILEQKKQQKQKELERKIVEDFVDKLKRKDKPKLWNFLFNWKKQ